MTKTFHKQQHDFVRNCYKAKQHKLLMISNQSVSETKETNRNNLDPLLPR